MSANLSEILTKSETDHVSATDVSGWHILTDILAALDRSTVEYVILGDTTRFPDLTSGDVDLAIGADDFAKLEAVLVQLQDESPARLVQVIEHEQTSRFYVLAWKGPAGRPQYLQLDVCSDYFRSGTLLMTADEFIGERENHTIHGADVYLPSREAALTYYLIKKIEKGSISVEQNEYLLSTLSRMTEPQRADVASRFGFPDAAEFGSWIKDLASSKNAAKPGATFKPNTRTTIVHRLREVARLIRRVASPNGLFVVLMGPDGSGKTTINNLSREYTETAFWGVRYLHFRPFLGISGDDDDIVEDPHAEPPRGTLSSIAKLAYYVFDYALGYLTKIRPCLSRSGLVIFDRYYEDMQIDQRRYRYGGPRFLLNLARWFVPTPDLYVFLDGDANVIQSRKQEVSFAETERQVDAYRTLASALPNAELCDASLEPEDVAICVSWKILDMLSDKTIQRIGGKV
ncbi:MAG: hypothetical protein HKN43_01250 [Rhodothermales bacterium]|nr:hypothetical protein [Rhodothermales bacterium]